MTTAPVEKLSISVPTDIAQRVRDEAGPRGVSRFVSEALRQHLLLVDGRRGIQEYEAEFGVITQEERDAAMRDTLLPE